jgi:hypothetical protein
MISEKWFRNSAQGNGRDVIWIVVPIFRTKENSENLRMTCLRAEIWIQVIPNKRQECCPLDLNVRFKSRPFLHYDKVREFKMLTEC